MTTPQLKAQHEEAVHRAALCKLARETMRGWVIFRHEEYVTQSGTPDISMTGIGSTTWIDTKHATPDFTSRGIQELAMNRLALAGHAIYVVYWEVKKEKRTYIVEPKDIAKPIEEWSLAWPGFDHAWVLDYVRKIHEARK